MTVQQIKEFVGLGHFIQYKDFIVTFEEDSGEWCFNVYRIKVEDLTEGQNLLDADTEHLGGGEFYETQGEAIFDAITCIKENWE